jgi:hypothetical protein
MKDRPRSTWLTPANVAWLIAYLLLMSGVSLGMHLAREQAIANFASSEAQAEWDEFRNDMKKIADDPRAPVNRRVPESVEPPTLRLLRDHYATTLALALLLTSLLFGTLTLMVRGVLSGDKFSPRAD